MASNDNEVAERRRDARHPLDGTVRIRLPAQAVVGSGENVSDDGVHFVADTALQVEVELPGQGTVRRGELVRVSPMGGGRVGFAIRFPPEPGPSEP